MAKPALTDTGERLYAQLAPTYFKEDERYGWAGAIFVTALAKMLDGAAEVVQPSGTRPPFAVLFDVANVAERWLSWLAQFVGVDLTTSPNAATSRAWIKSPLGYTRGTTAAMKLAAEATLTGSKTLFFYTRYNEEAFRLKAASLATQTANPTATREAIESMMPAWIVLEYETVAGGTMAILEASHAKISEIEAAHPMMSDLELHPEK